MNAQAGPFPDPELERAYRNTTYIVDVPDGAMAIRIGERCPRLDALLAKHGTSCWALVTAWNPRSEQLSNKNNELRNKSLCAELRQRGYAALKGRGQADAGDWPPEESLLVLGMVAADAVALGARYGQHAVVTGVAGECAVLRWCAGGNADTIPS